MPSFLLFASSCPLFVPSCWLFVPSCSVFAPSWQHFVIIFAMSAFPCSLLMMQSRDCTVAQRRVAVAFAPIAIHLATASLPHVGAQSPPRLSVCAYLRFLPNAPIRATKLPALSCPGSQMAARWSATTSTGRKVSCARLQAWSSPTFPGCCRRDVVGFVALRQNKPASSGRSGHSPSAASSLRRSDAALFGAARQVPPRGDRCG